MLTAPLQVMNGLKNYTVVTGEGEVGALIQREREALRPDECCNIDTVGNIHSKVDPLRI